MGKIADEKTLQVCLFNTPFDAFDYCFTEEIPLPPLGARVKVPFRNQERIGIVIGHAPSTLHKERIKSIISVIDETDITLPKTLFSLCRFISQYYHAPLSHVLALAIPKKIREGKTPKEPKKKQKKYLVTQENEHPPLMLHDEQKNAIQQILDRPHSFHCFLLHGITGSGKTEVYLQLSQSFLAQNKQILILVPEIGLTPQIVSRFQARFQEPIGVLHSNISDTERAFLWQAAKQAKISIIIGTRSALFTPMPHLGLIIIDEEQDLSFKQMEKVRFSARDMAIILAHQHNIPIVLGSATPSLESYYKAITGKYTLLSLSHRAIQNDPLYFELIDTRLCKLEQGLSPQTLQSIQKALLLDQQVLIFINRRGFSPIWLCTQCQWIADCTPCHRHLTVHQNNKLICHHCHTFITLPKICPKCNQSKFIPIGTGTQRIDECLKSHFPDHPLIRMDRDCIHSAKDWDQALQDILNHKVKIIIGTQMIAKGHHFPNLGLVVILEVDLGLYHPDFHAQEHLGQLITQVSGRTGRAGRPGHVLIQTNVPHHPTLQLLIQQGYVAFIKEQLKERQTSHWPPYTFLALIRAHGKHKQALIDCMNALYKQLMQSKHPLLKILGPAPAPQEKKAHHFYRQILIKSSCRKTLHDALKKISIHQTPSPWPSVQISIDVDPVDLN